MRLFTTLCGIRLTVSGLNQLPKTGCVVVANHCSYLDGPLLAMALPPHFSMVIKREAGDVPLVGFFLRRLQHILVERKQARRAAQDAQQIIDHLEAGEAVGIFAEGTFHAQPGVHRFKPSAFIGACRHQVAVVPIGIQGTRHIWPDKRRSLRPGLVQIHVMPAINTADYAAESERQQARVVAEAAREVIAKQIGEPLV